MKIVKVRYGIGYGSHSTEFEVEDDCPEEQIEADVRDTVMERLDWSYEVEDIA